MSKNAFKVFISHVNEDQTVALALKEYIEQIFLDSEVFVSGRDLAGGNLWIEELRRQLESAIAIIALISPYSRKSKWVHFESGAGFHRQCTIPLAVGDIQIDSLEAPMKFLQARNLDQNGMISLTDDLANMAGIRKPSRYPGLEEALTSINDFLKIRSATKVTKAEVSTIKTTKIDEDQALRQRKEKIVERSKTLLISAISKRSAPFDLPSSVDMAKMKYGDLIDLANAVGLSHPIVSLLVLFAIPKSNMPPWERINAEKRLEAMEKEWDKFEKDHIKDRT